MKKPFGKFIVGALLATLAFISPSFVSAQPAGGQPDGPGGPSGGGRGGPGGMMRLLPVMVALDTDQNYEVSAKEIDNASTALHTLDKNQDGILGEDELRPDFGGRGGGPGGPGAAVGGPTPAEAVTRMMAWDKDKDSKLTDAELPNRMESLMARADVNKDGSIARDELTKLMELEQGSGGGRAGGPGGPPDGGRGGPGGMTRSLPVMAALDTDQNGQISGAEIDQASAELRKLDKNQDGKLAEDELRPDFGGRGGPSGGVQRVP